MNEITIPLHLLVPATVSGLAILFIFIFFKRLFVKGTRKTFWISSVAFFLLYGFATGSAAIEDMLLQKELIQYDLNKDGFFGADEINEKQELAMARFTNDVGRNFIIFTGLLFSMAISSVIYLVGWGFLKYKSTLRQNYPRGILI